MIVGLPVNLQQHAEQSETRIIFLDDSIERDSSDQTVVYWNGQASFYAKKAIICAAILAGVTCCP